MYSLVRSVSVSKVDLKKKRDVSLRDMIIRQMLLKEISNKKISIKNQLLNFHSLQITILFSVVCIR